MTKCTNLSVGKCDLGDDMVPSGRYNSPSVSLRKCACGVLGSTSKVSFVTAAARSEPSGDSIRKYMKPSHVVSVKRLSANKPFLASVYTCWHVLKRLKSSDLMVALSSNPKHSQGYTTGIVHLYSISSGSVGMNVRGNNIDCSNECMETELQGCYILHVCAKELLAESERAISATVPQCHMDADSDRFDLVILAVMAKS
jgi:hypothetical protein